MTPEELTQEEIGSLYAVSRERLMPYAILVDETYDLNWHLQCIAQELEDAEKSLHRKDDKQIFLIIEVPPRHGKSELCSIKFPAWFIGKNPDKHIITASYSQDLSVDFGAKARAIVRSESHKSAFPNMSLSQDTQAKDRWMTNKGGSYTSVGVGGTLTGRGAHFLLIDDPHKDRAEADSLHMRNKIWEWFRSTAYSRLEPRGVVVVIMQRWHKDDLVGRIEKEFSEVGTIDIRKIKLPAIAVEDEENRQRGEALWPARYNNISLSRIQVVQGLINFSSQYQQEPILQENQTFKEEHFRYFEEDDLAEKELIYTTTIDLATGDKEVENGDFVAIITVGKERDKSNWYVVDCSIEHLDPLQCCDYLFALYKKYRMVNIGIETNAYQKTFKFWLFEEMKKRGVFMPIQEIHSAQSKDSRIRGLVGYYQTGVVFHRKSYMLLESQFLNFPQDKHDDGPDAMAMQLEVQLPTASENNSAVEAARRHVSNIQGQQNVLKQHNPLNTTENALLARYRQTVGKRSGNGF